MTGDEAPAIGANPLRMPFHNIPGEPANFVLIET